jgi:hypothetical protein
LEKGFMSVLVIKFFDQGPLEHARRIAPASVRSRQSDEP